MNADLLSMYPLNLARAVFASDDEALAAYIPGVADALATLTEREQGVIACRFERGLTLEQTAKEYGITRERIRQVEAKALRKLRHPTRISMMRAVPRTELHAEIHAHRQLQNDYDLLAKAFETLTAKKAEPGVIIPMAEQASRLETPLENLDLSIRSYNALKRRGINTIRDITEMSESELMKVRNLGRKSVAEVKAKLTEYGVELRKEERENEQ